MSLAYDHLRLHVTDDCFYFVPLFSHKSHQGISEVLLIDRRSDEISLKNDFEIPPTTTKCKEIYGIFGIIRLVNGPNLIVVTERERVGIILGKDVWRVVKFEIMPYKKSNFHLNPSQKSDLSVYMSMLEESLNTQAFYYSSSLDLTHNMQRIHTVDGGFFNESMCSRADQRFVWNMHALSALMEHASDEIHRFALPVMHGMIKIASCFVAGRTFDIALISRRSNRRAGTRYNVRGVDDSGDVANFVETEQIVFYGQYICSLVQTRGSIPLLWSQFPNIKYKPKPDLGRDHTKHVQYFKRHFDSQSVLYGKQCALNLVNQHGSENTLQEAFKQLVCDDGNKIGYEAFDFHHHCGQNKWHNLKILMDRIELSQTAFGYFMMVGGGGHVTMKQSGVFRTNCMDCLDRTNVVQSLIARRSLTNQLVQLGIMNAHDTIESQKSLNETMREIWADNADFCSIQYAGTGALKTDFTRTGKRTVMGMIKDGVNSAVRYWKNNFQDGFRQDGIDLLLGNFVVDAEGSTRSPFSSEDKSTRHLMALSYIIFSLVIISYFQSAQGSARQYSLMALWALVTISMARYVLQRGTRFVNSPLLFHKKNKLD